MKNSPKDNGTVEIKRTFNCSKRALFDAWSNPKLMARWFFAGQDRLRESTVVNSFTVGGKYELTMHLPSGEPHMHGTYRHINRYGAISFTWNSPIANESLVELTFKELSPNRTELTLKHSLFPSEASRDQHANGWAGCIESLEIYLAA